MGTKKLNILFLVLLISVTGMSQGFYQNRKIVNSDRRHSDDFGAIIATDGQRMAIGSDREVFIFKKDAANKWVEEAKIEGEGSTNNQFGSAIAIYGDYLAVGANEDDRDSSGANFLLNTGAVYLFKRDSVNSWHFIQKLIAPVRRFQDRFGVSVALNDSSLLVGAYLHEFNPQGQDSISNSGAVFHYRMSAPNTWVLKQKIVPSDRSEDDWFGIRSILEDKTLLVSSIKKDFEQPSATSHRSEAGAVYVFEMDSMGHFVETQKLLPSDPQSQSFFGYAMDIDKDVMIIGAYNHPLTGPTFDDVGAAYIFEKDSSNLWTEANKITPKDGQDIDRFAISVVISGKKAAVGSYLNDTDENGLNDVYDAGAVYTVEKDYFDQWTIQQKIVSNDRSSLDHFGSSVFLDSTSLLVGAVHEDGDSVNQNPVTNAGAVYAFEQCISNGISYSSELNILAANEDSASYQWLSCDSLSLTIPQETKQTYKVPTNGFYSVEVTKNGCTDTSACLWINCVSDSITLINDSLFAFEQDANYQWFKNDSGLVQIMNEGESVLPIKESGSYVLVVEKNGCRDTSVTVLVCLPLQLSKSDNVFTVSESSAKYQWFSCDSSLVPLVGDTLQSYTVTNDGFYRVAVSKNNCVDTSNCFYAKCISTAIFKNNDTLTAFQDNAKYQWFKNDSTYEVLPNDTNQIYVVLENGKYAVEIRKDGCIDTSAAISVHSIGVKENTLYQHVTIGPNPTNGQLTIKCEECVSPIEAVLYSTSGNVVLRFKSSSHFNKELDISFLEKGLYLLELRNAKEVARHKVLKL